MDVDSIIQVQITLQIHMHILMPQRSLMTESLPESVSLDNQPYDGN